MSGLKGWVVTAVGLVVLAIWGYFGVSMLFETVQRADVQQLVWPIAVLFIPLAFVGTAIVFFVCAVIPPLRRASDDRKGGFGFVVAVLIGAGLVGYAWTAGRGEYPLVAAALGPACQGQSVAGAGTLATSGVAANHIAVLDESGHEWLWTYATPAEWRPPDVADAELVACIPKEDATEAIEVCPYRNGPDVTRYRTTRAISVVEARTGREVATFSITLQPRACHQTEDLNLRELKGDSIGWSMVQEHLSSLVDHGSFVDPDPWRAD